MPFARSGDVRIPTTDGQASGVDRPQWRGGRRDLVGIGLAVFGLYLVAISGLMIVSPGTFFTEIGPFGVRNDHYTIDAATFGLALGLGALVAMARQAWRVPVLAITTVQFATHAVNHLVDIQEADPEWVGVADFVGLALGTLVLAWLLRRALRGTG